MSLQSSKLVLQTLPSFGDTPPAGGIQPSALDDGIHLRWAFERSEGFPWRGYYLFRRPAGEGGELQCVLPHLQAPVGATASKQLDLPLGRFTSDAKLAVRDDFAPAGKRELDLAGRGWLRFTLPPGTSARRVQVHLGGRGEIASELKCVDFGESDSKAHPNPFEHEGVKFSLSDKQRKLFPKAFVRPVWPGRYPPFGLDCDYVLEAELPQPSSSVRVKVVQLAGKSEILGLDAARKTVATASTAGTGHPEMVTLAGNGIKTVVVNALNNKTYVLELCWGAGRTIPVTAHFGTSVMARKAAPLSSGSPTTVTLDADAITSVEIGSGPAVLIDICMALVSKGATTGWKPVPKCPQPLALPVRHPDYAADSRSQNAASDETTALARIRYGNPTDMAGSAFSDLRGELIQLVKGGPSAGPMAGRETEEEEDTGDPNAPKLAHHRPLDLVLLGCLQPAIAQMVGLYWTDDTVVKGSSYDYLVVADQTGAGGGTAAKVLAELQGNGFTKLDGWICFGVRHGASPALQPPTYVRSYALPGLTIDASGGNLDAPNNAGLRWAAGTDPGASEGGVMFHVWRGFLGNGTSPSQPGSPTAITQDAPVLPTLPMTTVPSTTEKDWPPFVLHYVDRGLAEGWYAYYVSDVDIFGRHSTRSAAAPWEQWSPEPVPRPWYYTSPPSNAQVHGSAVRLLDKIPPPRPTAVEAYALDPDDPLLVRDAAFNNWWATLSAAEQGSVIGLRVRWKWTADHMAQAPDTKEFRIYVNPGSTPPVDHGVARNWAERVHVVQYADHVTVTTDTNNRPLRTYEIFLPVPADTVRTGVDLPVPESAPVVYVNVGVTACDSRPHTLDDPKWAGTRWANLTGNEGEVGPPATIYRVRRTPPDAPAVPAADEFVYATPADYESHSFYTYRWFPKANLKTHVFRAMDDAVFGADWEYRNLNAHRADLVATDTTYFPPANEPRWDAAKRAQVADEINDLKSLPLASAMSPAVRAAYEGLSNDALRVLAGLEGNDAAFTQQNIEPLDPNDAAYQNKAGPDNPKGFVVDQALRIWIDTLDGASTNRYLYRAAYIDAANNISALSLSTAPVWLPDVVPPRSPVLAGITAGDRSVEMRWTAVPRTDRYLVYRTDDRDSAGDVRSMGDALVELPAQPLVVDNGEIDLGEDARGVTAEHVYLLADVLEAQDPLPNPQPTDQLSAPTAITDGVVSGLQLANGTEVVVVYEDDAGGSQQTVVPGLPLVWTDFNRKADVMGWYALVASRDTVRGPLNSRPCPPAAGRSYDLSFPAEPVWDLVQWVRIDSAGSEHPYSSQIDPSTPAIHLDWSGVEPGDEVLLERISAGQIVWSTVSQWTKGPTTFLDTGMDETVTYRYRLRVRRWNGNAARGPAFEVVGN